jgi:glycerol-3-phosphate acyltransferase PlsY
MLEAILAFAGGYLLGSIPFAFVITKLFGLGDIPAMTAALGAFTGHIFPVWLGFKGGKGVATFIGILAALSIPIACIVAATWITVALVSRISSLSALIAAALSPVYMLIFDRWEYAAGATVLAALIFVTHRENIRRLLKGEEPRIGEAK